MKNFRPAVFAVVYAKVKNKIEFLILKRKLHWIGWEFTKGKIEEGEKTEVTAKREAREETGLKILKVKKFNISGKYFYNKKLLDRPNYIGQTYSLFSVEAKKGKVSLDPREHSSYKWVSFEKALKMLTWPNQRRCLRIVNKKLNLVN